MWNRPVSDKVEVVSTPKQDVWTARRVHGEWKVRGGGKVVATFQWL